MNQKRFLQQIEPIKDKMFRLARRLLVSKEAAEDATQDVLVKLWKRKETLKTYDNLEAFAMTVTKNHCLDELRLKRNNNLRIVHNNYEDHQTGLQKQLETKNELELVEHLINELPQQQQVIIQLREIEQMEYDAIAKILNMNETAVRVNLSRARKKLRSQMQNLQDYGIAEH
ncbi:RNA polymerase sigma factor [Croceibacter atlanticus]|jgi:RNA polymerase sigma-70 factor (ECF subfamily)|uniref:Putative extracytoplasmic function alternative sigma factor n=1 Tax=Croceibacter atlanticus (strain ATCC BAA-628 / JCM 21780 / CIP 108009 / IAM 15332 / KCTC 12090 / HTCC2559) TaxID=216432 RepID=A3U912_CROAH|nr:sigma-70 family RNA polymerase sigma factor [Croceibacter atlanticus]EAP86298.1 putative extracytoplasmic function alternative sigma factor [Croceibacter atlanticus HTCC2559]MBW4968829.1 sigma-70 family RNA polymerase sigma factor [Croceibacter atlanticus]|tara:strand:- start:1239 stop:1754 length:516 start_codon:yes stop_codon:yes gene_type:complete